MSKGQNASKRIKKILKFFKLNENTISTLMGGIVVIVIAGLIFNYFRTTNLKSFQGTLLSEQEAATTVNTEGQSDKLVATYTVAKGDDLWHIAEKFYRSGYNYVDIMKENKITGTGVIVAGQVFINPNVYANKITF
jgi:LysM repeat protein